MTSTPCAAGDELRARERAEQVGDRHQEQHDRRGRASRPILLRHRRARRRRPPAGMRRPEALGLAVRLRRVLARRVPSPRGRSRCPPTSTSAPSAVTSSRSGSRSATSHSRSTPGAGASSPRCFQPVGIVLKGSGFYKTDSRSGGSSSPRAGDSSTSEHRREVGTSPVEVGSRSPTRVEASGRHGLGELEAVAHERAKTTTGRPASPPDLGPSRRTSPAPRRSRRSPSREGIAMFRRSPRALALWGAAARRRGGDRGRRRRRPRLAPPPGRRPRTPRSTLVVATPRPRGRHRARRRRSRRRARCTDRSCRPASPTVPRARRAGGHGAGGAWRRS